MDSDLLLRLVLWFLITTAGCIALVLSFLHLNQREFWA